MIEEVQNLIGQRFSLQPDEKPAGVRERDLPVTCKICFWVVYKKGMDGVELINTILKSFMQGFQELTVYNVPPCNQMIETLF